MGVEEEHDTHESLETETMTPPHPPRVETPEYKATHEFLVKHLDSPCDICGVRNSTLADSAQNPFGAKALETHHFPIERSLIDACDPAKVSKVFFDVVDKPSFERFIDSKQNMRVLCDVHHRSKKYGIHHLAVSDFEVQKFLLDGYEIAASKDDAQETLKHDMDIIGKEGMGDSSS